LDLNRFKTINDTRGHLVGDRLLQAVAGRLRQAVRASDTVGRLGGDEFAVLLSSTDVDGATLVASKIVEAVSQPFAIDGALLSVGVSVGIACFPDHGTRAEQLLGASDRAMYTAKSAATGLAVAAAEPTPPV
jgi:diguanylate cyclase (GGDEF)-like protein